MENRKMTKADLDKVRNIEGFPQATDEDIIALSRAPYYTACPNPFLTDFVQENCTAYDEDTDDYQCEPFTSDVSEGKYDPIYKLHPYHTKVPHKAIMKYILHYTKPGDLVFDGFCGTGQTGVAAALCGSDDGILKAELMAQMKGAEWGERRAIISDLAPAATFIAQNYCNPISDMNKFSVYAEEVLKQCKSECSWMYETNHEGSGFIPQKGFINYTIWSDVFICPHCGKELVFWDVAVDYDAGKVRDKFKCDSCGSLLKKSDCSRAKIREFDEGLQEICEFSKQVPVRINYSVGTKRFEKRPDETDLETMRKIADFKIPYKYPTDPLPTGYNTEQPKNSHGLTHVHHFYTKRNLIGVCSR